jgi:murein DD-endopeptidase MepM/ murein hydrolase activator NlpD
MQTTLSDLRLIAARRHALRKLVALASGTALPPVLAQSLSAATGSGQPRSESDLPPLSQPVTEVAAFRVAPVAPAATAMGAIDLRAKNITPDAMLLPRSDRMFEARVQKNETWYDLLRRAAGALAVALPDTIAQTKTAALPLLLPGKYARARAPADAALEIEYVVSAEAAYAVTLDRNGLFARALAGDPRLIERVRADPAKASLFTATDATGLPESIALQITEIFAGEVDFLRELHLGYRCALVYEAQYREGFIERAGRILAVELDVGKQQFGAYHASDTRGQGTYFDASGKRSWRFFRRMPLEFTRVTSDYTLARFHPILGVWTAHRGVDYAAPAGTKIMAVADGVVTSVGAQGGYGNLVVLRHQEKYQTYYAHMSAYAPKLAVGSKVTQGETLGFVGMTGLATGPHLHFEFHVRNAAGVWVSVPAPDVIDTTVVAAPGFARQVEAYRDSMAVAGRGNYLILE